MRKLIAILLLASCGTYEPAYTTRHGVRVFLEDDLEIEQSDVEMATQIFIDTVPDYGKKLKPMTVWFENELIGDCNNPEHSGGCTVGTGHLFILWSEGFKSNAYFHELLHGTGYRLTGIADPSHVLYPFKTAIPQMQTSYILQAPTP